MTAGGNDYNDDSDGGSSSSSGNSNRSSNSSSSSSAVPVEIDASVAPRFMPGRDMYSRKGRNGKVLVVGGSYVYHGAPILSSLAALRFGADLVYTAVPKHNVQATRAASADLIVLPMADAKLTRGSASKLIGMLPTGLDSAAIGMGLAVHERGALLNLARSLVEMDVRLVLDASALVPEVLPLLPNTNSIITPHAGEFEHMFGLQVPPHSDMRSRIRTVSRCASENNIVILLKGPVDVISDGATTYLCRMGVPGMTVGGTGDVLAGVAAGALAVCRDPLKAAAAAAYTNNRAGEIVASGRGYHMLASDLIGTIPDAIREFDVLDDGHGDAL